MYAHVCVCVCGTGARPVSISGTRTGQQTADVSYRTKVDGGGGREQEGIGAVGTLGFGPVQCLWREDQETDIINGQTGRQAKEKTDAYTNFRRCTLGLSRV